MRRMSKLEIGSLLLDILEVAQLGEGKDGSSLLDKQEVADIVDLEAGR